MTRYTGSVHVVLASLLALAGCDLVFLDDRDAPAADGAVPESCVLGTPFPAGTPVQIGTLGYSVEGARFSPDQQTAYLSLCDLGQPKTTCELWRARYFPEDKRFAELFQLEMLDEAGAYDAYPTITADGRFFLWSSDRGAHVDVYVVSEDNGQFPASNITTLAAAADIASNEPYVLRDSQTVYFGGSVNIDDNWDLFRARGPGPGFGAREPITSLNTMAGEFAPVASDDELEIFFASNRDSGDSLDIYTAIRTNRNDPFGAVHRVAALSTPSPGIDWPLWLSPDLCTLYYINKTDDTTMATASLYVTSRR